MAGLKSIQEAVAKFATVISRVLQVDVEIVDDTLFRVAGTGRFADRTGSPMDAASVAYRRVLELGRPLIIEEPGFADICRSCPCWRNCEETFEMSTPVTLDGKVVGVIGFVCFDEEQKRHILDNFEVFFDFLAQMGDLLAAKVRESRELMKSKAVGDLLESIVNRVDEGVLLLDGRNAILRCNSAAGQILDLGAGQAPPGPGGMLTPGVRALPPVELNPVSQGVLHYEGYELKLGERVFQVVGQEHELNLGDCARVFVFHDAQAMHRNAYRLTAMADRVGLDVFVGESEPMQELKGQIRNFAATSATTLVIGESGTGKELVARALHDESDRADDVFVAVNCSAIPETLLESELFGYVGGAFTGADPRGRMGKFEQANGGTLFLDEIGDFALHLQPRLLRVLEQREVTRIGAQSPTPVDIRIIAATNRNLEKMVREGMFREDLYYRLNVLPIAVPPLRERGNDALMLAQHFLERCFERLDKSILAVRDCFWRAVGDYHWPGNVRELQNVMEYIANVAPSPCVVTGAMLPAKVTSREETIVSSTLHLPTIERCIIEKALAPYGGPKAGREEKEIVAGRLGIGIATLYRKLKKFGMER
jgi:transcriptional regulator with PAS, ATPase and Fis domain